jgi:hypothetical protein
MGRHAAVIICGKSAMFGNGTQSIDHPPQREKWQYPQHRVGEWHARGPRHRCKDELHDHDVASGAPRARIVGDQPPQLGT